MYINESPRVHVSNTSKHVRRIEDDPKQNAYNKKKTKKYAKHNEITLYQCKELHSKQRTREQKEKDELIFMLCFTSLKHRTPLNTPGPTLHTMEELCHGKNKRKGPYRLNTCSHNSM